MTVDSLVRYMPVELVHRVDNLRRDYAHIETARHAAADKLQTAQKHGMREAVCRLEREHRLLLAASHQARDAFAAADRLLQGRPL